MHRFSCMAQLGVDVYAPRRLLPAAADSVIGLQARVLPRPDPVGAESPGPPVNAPRARPNLDLPEIAARPAPRKAPAATSATTPAAGKSLSGLESVRFQLLTVAFDSGVLFISDLRSAPLQPALEATVMQFLHELMFALGRPAANPVAPLYFQWPLVSTPGADISAPRAREVLAGFIDRCVRETRPGHIVLLGERASEFVQSEGEQWGATPVRLWRSVALGKLFAQPGLKAELWRALQPLVVNG